MEAQLDIVGEHEVEKGLNCPVTGKLIQRMQELYSLKQHKLLPYRKIKQEYRLTKLKKKVEDYATYRMNTGFALVNTKAAEILANTPEFDFIALDDEAKRNIKQRKLFWDWLWLTSKTDFHIYRIVMDALKYGVGIGLEDVVVEKRIVNDPIKTKVKGVYKFKQRDIIDYEGCKLTHIPWNRVLVNGTHINNATEAFVFEEYDRDEFFQVFGNNPFYSNVTQELIPHGKYYYVGVGDDAVFYNYPQTKDMLNYRKVTVAKYWNKPNDQYIVLANNRWINPIRSDMKDGMMEPSEDSIWQQVMPIPNPNKEIPLVAFTDHMIDDDFWGLGEFEVTEDSRALKDETRSLQLEVIKAQSGIITISPDADWDEATIQFGIRRFARVDKDDIGFFAPNINTSSLNALESKLDEDIIIESGVDFRGQLLGPNETATKTAGRIDSAKKRINLNMKYNAHTFYERLARLRMSNMEWYYGDKSIKIPLKGAEETEDGVVEALSGGYGLFTMKPKYWKGKMNVVPQIDSLMSNSTATQKQKYIEFAQFVLNMVDPDTGKPVANPRKIIEAGRGIIDDVIDLDKVLESSPTKQDPMQILKDAGAIDAGPSAMGEALAPGAVPPAQRSGRPVLLPSSPNIGE